MCVGVGCWWWMDGGGCGGGGGARDAIQQGRG